MTLGEFKNYIESFPEGKIFDYGISEPFSWRGSYDEVAFQIIQQPMERDEILAKINTAYKQVFQGYKGGDYTYNDYTYIHFEEGIRYYTDGGYCAEMIAKIEGSKPYKSQETRLVNIAFK